MQKFQFHFISFDAIVANWYVSSLEHFFKMHRTIEFLACCCVFLRKSFYISFINYVSSARTELDISKRKKNNTIDLAYKYVLEFRAKKKINANWEIKTDDAPKMQHFDGTQCTMWIWNSRDEKKRKKIQTLGFCCSVFFLPWKNVHPPYFQLMFFFLCWI